MYCFPDVWVKESYIVNLSLFYFTVQARVSFNELHILYKQKTEEYHLNSETETQLATPKNRSIEIMRKNNYGFMFELRRYTLLLKYWPSSTDGVTIPGAASPRYITGISTSSGH